MSTQKMESTTKRNHEEVSCFKINSFKFGIHLPNSQCHCRLKVIHSFIETVLQKKKLFLSSITVNDLSSIDESLIPNSMFYAM